MRKLKNLWKAPEEPEAVITFKLIRRSFQDIHTVDAKRTRERLKKQSGWLARLRSYLFEQPLKSYFYILISFSLLLLFGAIVVREFDDIVIRALFFIVSSLLYFLISTFLYLITPNPDMDYDERWKLNLRRIKQELQDPNKNLSEVEELQYIKTRIQRSINHYHRNGGPAKFIIELMWGGIFIGCLPDTKFQKALLFFPDMPKIWATNPFGAIALVSVLFIGPIYHFKYRIPKVWMEQVIIQIELNDIS